MTDLTSTSHQNVTNDFDTAGEFSEEAVLTNVAPALYDDPPVQARNTPNLDSPPPAPENAPNLIVTVLVPLLCLFVLISLTITAHRTWIYYKKRKSRDVSSNKCNIDEVSPEVEPLNQEINTMQIVQETDYKQKRSSKNDDENLKRNSCSHSIKSNKSNTSAEQIDPEKPKNKVTVEVMPEKPNTLKFLAASVAFQQSTVPALKRLPYTPDPDYGLYQEQYITNLNQINEGKSKEDSVPPLSLKFRMKPRGLLERRGSNVALTISLRAGEKAPPGNPLSSKSPKPLAYLQQASSPLTPNSLQTKSCDTLKLQQEFWEIPMNHPSEKNFNIAGHGTKNRYRTILPNHHSRVKLPATDDIDPLSTYINANYIRNTSNGRKTPSSSNSLTTPVGRSDATFIATQGPMANTIGDFWRMVWHENSFNIIMITKLKERKEKCSLYIPMELDETKTYDDITVTVKQVKSFEHFTVRKLKLQKDGQSRTVNHHWYTTWMDHETPEKTRGLLELVQDVSLNRKDHHGPMVVHCSAGIGRTGCYIAVTVGCQQLLKTGRVDILKIVSHMRLDRGGMIQTWEQYQFVHQALGRYTRILSGENVTTPSTSGSIKAPPDAVETPKTPKTPKHRRSLSGSSMPASKGLKIGDNSVNGSSNNSRRTKKLTIEIESSDHWREHRKEETPPPTPSLPESPLILPDAVVRSVSSPTIRSPFGRLCLQKDRNGKAPVKSSQFDFPDARDHVKSPASVKFKENNVKKSKPRFNLPQIQIPRPRSPLADCNNPTQKRFFAFDSNLVVPPSPRSDKPTKTDNYKDQNTPPGTNSASLKSISSHFVFPTPDKR